MTEKIVQEIIHYEDEELVGIVVDYKTAAVLCWLTGQGAHADKYSAPMYNKLYHIDEVRKEYSILSWSDKLRDVDAAFTFEKAYGEK